MTKTVTIDTNNRASSLRLIPVVLGLIVAIILMLLSFLSPAMASGPSDLPLAVSGPKRAIEAIENPAEAQAGQQGSQEGFSDIFDLTTYDSPDDVVNAVKNREAIGGLILNPSTPAEDVPSGTQSGAQSAGSGAMGTAEVIKASGAGTPYAPVLTKVGEGLKAKGFEVTTRDVAPLTKDDPKATGLSVLALPLAFGGMASAALLTFTMKGRRWSKIVGSLLFSIFAGLAIGAILQFGYGSVEGNYFELAGILSLGIAATSMFVLGLESLLGSKGLGIGAILTLFLANPLSGIATGWQWLPSPWGLIGQLMPIGAAGNAARSVAYFDGQGITMSAIVLCAWIAIGISFVSVSSVKNRRQRATTSA